MKIKDFVKAAKLISDTGISIKDITFGSGKIYKERRVYFFVCDICGHKDRQSFKRTKANLGVCRNCKKNKVSENQIPLFERR